MDQPTSRRKTALFYLLTVLLSLLLAFGLLELVLRQLAYTNSVSLGGAAQERWFARNMAYSNEMGFRDIELRPHLHDPQRKIYFLGDSFTTGIGVRFEDTFYYKAGWSLTRRYNAFNLSRPGASTVDELNTLLRFNHDTGATAAVVVHQYFVNDIENYLKLPTWTAPPWLTAASRHLESAQLLRNYRFNQEWLPRYQAALRAAYADPVLLQRHLQDVARLHDAIRAQGGSVYFLVFPALSPDRLMHDTQPIVQRLRAAFARTCRPGDKFIDASVSAAQLSTGDRIVSFLDPHPSAELHTRVARQIDAALNAVPPGDAAAPLYESCELMARPATAAAGS